MELDAKREFIGRRIVFLQRGDVALEDFKLRQPRNDELLIKTVSSLISPGTETAFLMALPNTPCVFPNIPDTLTPVLLCLSVAMCRDLRLGIGLRHI